MTSHDYDPDDNFGQAFHGEADIDEEAAREALAWQLLLLVNPGDEDAALQQFALFQDALERDPDAATETLLREATDWKSGYFVDDDPRLLIEALDELAGRWHLRIDWGTDEPDDPGFLAGTDVPALLHTAFDRLREHHYSLWTFETEDGGHGGWITRQHDGEGLRQVAGALGLPVRSAGD